ncbi:hypothetical protein AVEN_30404-1 [Araneus ventricosus]|uniref:Uncharacterized protein n=1 Tax=Araneus ventricosus TaxID=182803 RepID=A0A4Y2FKP3_ARAVE|nr:hypothetical protein AVEN_30404-1 [Araneus ventricosus]
MTRTTPELAPALQTSAPSQCSPPTYFCLTPHCESGTLQTRRHVRKISKLNVHVFLKYPCLPAAVVQKFGEGMPAQVPSSSSDRGSELRGPSQNTPRAASEQDVNITKLN